MAPAFLPGDRLWVDLRALEREAPRPGDVVVARDPEDRDRWLLKRVSTVDVDDSGAWRSVRLLGDRREVSRDSRAFGDVPRAALLGLVWFRYAPESRRGPV